LSPGAQPRPSRPGRGRSCEKHPQTARQDPASWIQDASQPAPSNSPRACEGTAFAGPVPGRGRFSGSRRDCAPSGSQDGSQRAQEPGPDGRHWAIIAAGQDHSRRLQAMTRDRPCVYGVQEVRGSTPRSSTSQFKAVNSNGPPRGALRQLLGWNSVTSCIAGRRSSNGCRVDAAQKRLSNCNDSREQPGEQN
jgi:hypothetical protein